MDFTAFEKYESLKKNIRDHSTDFRPNTMNESTCDRFHFGKKNIQKIVSKKSYLISATFSV